MSLDLSNEAAELLADLGDRIFSVIRVTPPIIDPDTGLPTDDPTETKTTYNGALVGYSAFDMQNTNIQTGDKRLILEPIADYKHGDIIEFYNKRWSVVSHDEIKPAGIRQVWIFQVRSQ